MSRQARDANLSTRSARLKLRVRAEPHWRTIQPGRALGYRRLGGKGGTWIARAYEADRGRKYLSIGSADDYLDADGTGSLSFAQAQEKARAWFETAFLDPLAQASAALKTVRTAVEHYLADYETRGGKALASLRTIIDAHVLPAFGDTLLSAVSASAIKTWHGTIANAPPRRRTKAQPGSRTADGKAGTTKTDPEYARARRATANRVLTVLKAILNLAFRDGWVSSDEAWRRVRPFQQVDAPRIAFLDDVDAQRLVNACAPDFRRLVIAALLTGCRYGELVAIRVRDLDLAASTLHVPRSKSGKARHVHLTAEGVRFFTDLVAGHARAALVLTRADDAAWGKSHAQRPLSATCTAAKIAPAISFHALRHTYASRLARAGTPMLAIAAQLGHADTRVTARHYAHLAPDHVAIAVRAGFSDLGLVSNELGTITAIHPRAAA